MPFRFGGDAVHVYLTINSSYRFLRLSDVTDYKRRRDEATSKALDEMRSIADEDGAYDIDYSDYLSRFDK